MPRLRLSSARKPARTGIFVIAALIVLWALLFGRHPDAARPRPPVAAAPTVTPTAAPTVTATEDVDGEVVTPAEATWRPLVLRFMDTYLAGPAAGRGPWRAALTRDCTPTLAAGLADVDPANLPRGKVVDLDVITVDETGGGTAVVTLTGDQALDVTVVRVGARLAIADIEQGA